MTGLKLNLGCGERHFDGYINQVDVDLLLSESIFYNNLIEQIEMVLQVVKKDFQA
ncbi:hypothetical protein IQ264_02285 [Phormidium sp. LEGE 05292]|uniref:hypothetical protein n=1 Tax=[Phormidium] sp. LEGE 05292 TaxID=767427 RepID=UPI0018821966|nr:hypothetical protein [Phormidium sp. LEGE 05292]MBE9224301.1 hypothetical protein [Phormidium sp. LEGE 05292]